MVLLHLWAWDRFPVLAPRSPDFIDPRDDIFGLPPPLGYRWTCIGGRLNPRYDSLMKYRLILDCLTGNTPYCINNEDIWRANIPLICFHIIEWQHYDRVMHQFGIDQFILDHPVNIDKQHTLVLTGKATTNWSDENQYYIQLWNNWPA
ncbi:serine/threonine-protein phosphatase 7 long form-like protein [Senna tora]|uniref:Serine/threonine-protein phosphatase 7 long form-like protein n=1 Tax=Senna tora TaxID=362788 RepID=A0A834XH04_9FABA|nr:serine/threonine-protein phosphatase 7 long form-like protein [Senna tora]